MSIYSRNISKKLTSLRLLFTLFLISGFFTWVNANQNLFFFILVSFAFCSLIRVSNFKADIASFKITKYYFFGLLAFTWTFTSNDKLSITSEKSFEDTPDIIDGGDSDELGVFYGCLYSIIGKAKIGTILFCISKLDKTDKIISQVSLFLNFQEFTYAYNVANSKHAI